MGKKLAAFLIIFSVLFLYGCGLFNSQKPRKKEFDSRATGWLIKIESEVEKQAKQLNSVDSIQTKILELENKVDFLDNSTNDEIEKDIVNLQLEKYEVLKQISELKNEIGIDAKGIKSMIKIIKDNSGENPSEVELLTLANKLEELTIRNGIRMEYILDYSTRLKLIDEAISDLIVKECKLGRIISEEVIPFDYYFETGKCTTISDNPEFIIEFRNEIEKTILEFLSHCPNMKVSLTITIEGYSDSQKFSSNSREKNLILSECRAYAVKTALNYFRNDNIVQTNYKVMGLGEQLPYPQLSYQAEGTNDQGRRICKIKAVLRPM